MKKSTRKLVIDRETLRVLTKLEIVRVPGAGAAQLIGTDGPAQCVVQAVVLPQK